MFLTALVFLPILFALALWISPKRWIRPLSLAFAIVEFLMSLFLLKGFDKTTYKLQFVEKKSWIPEFGINYHLGIDGISIWLILLTTLLVPIIVLNSWESLQNKRRAFFALLFVLEASILGAFLAIDTVLFYIFWELSLIPMYFIIGLWGGAKRVYATIKFFIFTMAGSVLMLIAIIFLMQMTESSFGQMSASVLDFYKLEIPFVAGEFLSPQTLLFFAFALAFAVKIPVFPLHTWLPDAHVEAPTPGSVILAGVMLKMGTYGFMRFAMPIFPEATQYWSWLFLMIGTMGIIYGAIVAMVQTDMKKLVAYSSVSHMGYIVLGLFAINHLGVTGGLYQMLNHGISTGALFLLVGMIYDRTKSREIASYGGLAKVLPLYSIVFFIVTLSSIAVPLTNGFVGEFLILMGAFQAAKPFAIFAVLGVVLGAVYMLWMYRRVFFGASGEIVSNNEGAFKDLGKREGLVLLPAIVLIFWMGIFPNHFLSFSNASIDHFVENFHHYELEEVIDAN